MNLTHSNVTLANGSQYVNELGTCWESDSLIYFNYGGMGVLNTLIALFGIPANTFICYVVITTRLWSSNNFVFIFWLAVSDLLTCVVCIPIEAVSFYTYDWEIYMLPPIGVVFQNAIWYFCAAWTLYILFVMTLDRFLAVRCPLKHLKITKKWINIALVWTFIHSVGIFVFSFEMQEYPEAGVYDFIMPAWAEIVILLLLLLPLFANLAMYIYIFKIVQNRRKDRSKRLRESDAKRKFSFRKRVAINRLYIYMMLFVIIIWLPFSVYQIYLLIDTDLFGTCIGESVDSLLSTIIHLNIVGNAFIYGLSDVTFRRYFKKMFKCFWKGNSNQES
eukprot:TCONS_00002397-protein